MVHFNVGPRHLTVETPRPPSMLDLAAGAARAGLAGRALQLRTKAAMANPRLSARGLNLAARSTPRWPWESRPVLSMPWRQRGPMMPWRQRGLSTPRARGGMMMPWRQRAQPMPWLRRRWALLAGIALGGAMMFFLDLEQGNRRRKMTAQRGGRLVRQSMRTARRFGKKLGSDLAGKRQAMLHSDHREPLDDATLAHKVESVLFRDPHVPKGRINVNAEHGVVVIRGEVERPEEIRDIEGRVKDIDGVHQVRSMLHVANTPAA